MAEINDWLVKCILIGVFIIAIVTGGVMLGQPYGRSANDMTGNAINLTRIEVSINQTNVQASAWKTAFESDSPLISIGLLAVQSIWTTCLSMGNVILSMIDLYLFSISNILGIPPFVIGAITTIIIITLIFMIYKGVTKG